MSQLERQNENKNQKKNKAANQKGDGPTYLTFQPKPEEKAAIQSGQFTLDDCIDAIAMFLEKGYSWKVSYSDKRGCMFGQLATQKPNWRENVILTFWHDDVIRILEMAGCALRDRYSDPDSWPGATDNLDRNW